jgi:hypothetical protein
MKTGSIGLAFVYLLFSVGAEAREPLRFSILLNQQARKDGDERL